MDLSAHSNLFSGATIPVSSVHLEQMSAVVRAVEAVAALPAYQEKVLAGAAEVARFDSKTRGVFMGYDFHLTGAGPRLIEVNSNAGGACLNLAHGPDAAAADRVRTEFLAMFRNEWRLAGKPGPLASVAIVDTDPETQFLYPEFVLFRDMFERSGIRSVIADPSKLECHDNKITVGNEKIDLIYNRLTDFELAEPGHGELRAAYLGGRVVVTPNPRIHALFADKRNLLVLSDPVLLKAMGAKGDDIYVLQAAVPPTRLLSADNAEELWRDRRRYFFKPAAGFGSKAAYRGDKITKGVWAEIQQKNYIAQEFVAPSEHAVTVAGANVSLKVDIRNFAYDGAVQLVVARLYQGQTTNFRTPGGGFASVIPA